MLDLNQIEKNLQRQGYKQNQACDVCGGTPARKSTATQGNWEHIYLCKVHKQATKQ